MPDLDPNWFYSSLAQSAASVVGLFGGILATRVQADLERAAEQQIRATAALQKLDGRARPLSSQLELYLQKAPAQLDVISKAMAEGSGSFSPPSWYSPFDTGSAGASVTPDQHNLDVENSRLELTRDLVPHLRALLETHELPQLDAFGATIEPLVLSNPAEGMPDLLRRVATLANEAARELRILRVRTTASMMFLLVWCLGGVSVGGLVVPLLFLSAYRHLHRGILTAIFAMGLFVLLGYIGSRVSQLRRLGRYRVLLPPDPEIDAAS